MTGFRQGVISFTTALSLASPARRASQADTLGDTTSLETFCSRHRAALARGAPGEAYVRAISGIQSCGAMAGEVLAQQWRNPPGDSASVMLLGAVSANVRDQRVHEAARDIAMSSGASTGIRLAAIATLVAHADSMVRLSYFTFPEQPAAPAPGVGFGHPLSFYRLAPPGVPLQGSVWSDVVALLSRMGESDPNDRVRSVAAYIAKRMRAHAY